MKVINFNFSFNFNNPTFEKKVALMVKNSRKLLKNQEDFNSNTFEGIAGYGELNAPAAQIIVKLGLQLLVQAPGLAAIVELDASGGSRIPADGYEIVDGVHGVVLDRAVQNFQRPPLETVEGILFLAASLEHLGVTLGLGSRGGDRRQG